MATLSGNVALRHPESGEPVSLIAGSEVPEWATGLIGAHLIGDAEPDAEPDKPKRSRARGQ